MNMKIINIISATTIAILSGLGVGSGGLLVAYMSATGQADAASVRGLNLLFFVLSAGVASLLNIRSRRFDPVLIFIMAAAGIIGCILGVYIQALLTPTAVRHIFGWMLTLSGVYALFFSGGKKEKDKNNAGSAPHPTKF